MLVYDVVALQLRCYARCQTPLNRPRVYSQQTAHCPLPADSTLSSPRSTSWVHDVQSSFDHLGDVQSSLDQLDDVQSSFDQLGDAYAL